MTPISAQQAVSSSAIRGVNTVGSGSSQSTGNIFFDQLLANIQNNMTPSQPEASQSSARLELEAKAGQTGKPSPDSSLLDPMERLRQAMEATGQPLDSISLGADQRELLENMLLHSGYSQQDTEDILQRVCGADGSFNMGSLFGVMGQYSADQGMRLGLSREDRPALIQIFQELGIPQDSIDSFIRGLEQKGEAYLISGLPKLLEQARGHNGQAPQVDRDVMRDLLTRLGLNSEEINSVLNADGTEDHVQARTVMAALEAAARKQESELQNLLKEVALKAQFQQEAQAGEANRLRAEMIKALEQIEAQVEEQGKNFRDSLEQGQAAAEKSASALQTAAQTAAKANHTRQDSDRLAASHAEDKANWLKTETSESKAQTRSDSQQEQGAAQAETKAKADQTLPTLNQDGDGLDFAQTLQQAQGSRAAGGGAAVNLLPAQVVRQVGQEMARMVQNNVNTLNLQLKPPTLGEVHMALTVKDGIVKATIMAESVAAKQALEAGMDQLKQQLTVQGLKVEAIDVSVNPDAQQKTQERSAYERNRRQNSGKPGSEAAEIDDNNPETPRLNANGRLSVFA